MAIGGTSSATSTSNSAMTGSRQTIADNFDTFLSILTTQLKNQNPLDPLDTNQFTQQLVQFTSVEQQLKTNEFLEALMLSSQNTGKTDAVSFIGKEVTAAGVKAELKDGFAIWGFEAMGAAADATVTIKDSLGNVVYTEEGSLNKGKAEFRWDGVGSSGQRMPDGAYSIQIDARSLSGQLVAVTTSTTGKVTAVDLSGEEPVLTVGTGTIRLSDVTSVKTAS